MQKFLYYHSEYHRTEVMMQSIQIPAGPAGERVFQQKAILAKYWHKLGEEKEESIQIRNNTHLTRC